MSKYKKNQILEIKSVIGHFVFIIKDIYNNLYDTCTYEIQVLQVYSLPPKPFKKPTVISEWILEEAYEPDNIETLRVLYGI